MTERQSNETPVSEERDSRADLACESGFEAECRAFLEESGKKKKRPASPTRRWIQALALVLVVAFTAGVVLDGHYGLYDRILDMTGAWYGPGPAEESGAFSLEQDEPPASLSPDRVSPVVAIAEAALPSIVAIESSMEGTNIFGARFRSQGTGSGIIISEDGLIATNHHVVDGAQTLNVVLQDGTEVPAQVIGSDALSDLAVIRIDRTGLPAASLGDSDELRVGELVVALGSPVGVNFAGSVTAGIISGLNREVYLGDKTMNLIQTDAAINPGNSGGALVNANAQVIGINVLKFATAEVEGMSFSIPINEAIPILEELVSNGRISRPNLGIRGRDVTAEEAQTYDVPRGVLIDSVLPGSGAAAADIRPGDILTHFDGTRVQTIRELVDRVQSREVGDRVSVTLVRDAQTFEVAVTLGERSAAQ